MHLIWGRRANSRFVNFLKCVVSHIEVTICTLRHLICTRLVSVCSSHVPFKCIMLLYLRSSLPFINISVRIDLTFFISE